MENNNFIHEFYYSIGGHEPEDQYRLLPTKETRIMIYGRAQQLGSDGKYVCDAGMFRIYQGETDYVELKTTVRGATQIMVRVNNTDFERAKATAAKMAHDYLRELTNRLYRDDEYHPELPISIGDTLYKITTEPMGCHACPHGNQPMRHLCPYKCPENQFKIEEVVVDHIRTFLEINDDGSITLRDSYFTNRKIAEETIERKVRERKENKLAFEKRKK